RVRQYATKRLMPKWRMLPRVIGGPWGCFAAMGADRLEGLPNAATHQGWFVSIDMLTQWAGPVGRISPTAMKVGPCFTLLPVMKCSRNEMLSGCGILGACKYACGEQAHSRAEARGNRSPRRTGLCVRFVWRLEDPWLL